MNTERFQRKLSAILSADVKGYSRLMRADEDETIRTVTAYRTAIAKLAEQYRGRVVDFPGDNVLAMFGSGVDAVNCAVEIQRELADRNEQLPAERKMEFRIGVNSGRSGFSTATGQGAQDIYPDARLHTQHCHACSTPDSKASYLFC